MLADSAMPGSPSSLSPRAAMALLTLQLRGTRQELDAVNASAADSDVAIEELRAKVAPLLAERQAVLGAELDQERADAAARVAAAHARAAQIVDNAHRAAAEAAAAEAAAAEAAAAEAAAAFAPPVLLNEPPVFLDEPPVFLDEAPVMLAEAPVVEAPVAEEPLPEPLPEIVEQTLPPPAGLASMPVVIAPAPAPRYMEVPGTADGEHVAVVIDADEFARAFAAALGPVLAERAPAPQPQAIRIVQAAPPPKKSFWSNAKHADVLLSLVAMGIVLVVLFAWTR